MISLYIEILQKSDLILNYQVNKSPLCKKLSINTRLLLDTWMHVIRINSGVNYFEMFFH